MHIPMQTLGMNLNVVIFMKFTSSLFIHSSLIIAISTMFSDVILVHRYTVGLNCCCIVVYAYRLRIGTKSYDIKIYI